MDGILGGKSDGVDAGVDAGIRDAGIRDAGIRDAGAPGDADVDAGRDAGGGADAGPRGPTTVVQTSGGATVLENAQYRLRISVGGPQPMGRRETVDNTVILGPQGRQ